MIHIINTLLWDNNDLLQGFSFCAPKYLLIYGYFVPFQMNRQFHGALQLATKFFYIFTYSFGKIFGPYNY